MIFVVIALSVAVVALLVAAIREARGRERVEARCAEVSKEAVRLANELARKRLSEIMIATSETNRKIEGGYRDDTRRFADLREYLDSVRTGSPDAASRSPGPAVEGDLPVEGNTRGDPPPS